MLSRSNSRKVIVVRCSNNSRNLSDSLRTVRTTGTQKEFNLYLILYRERLTIANQKILEPRVRNQRIAVVGHLVWYYSHRLSK
jgi:hypothetical protein